MGLERISGKPSTLFRRTHNQVAGPGQVDSAYLGESRSLHPASIFGLTVYSTGVGANEHIHRE